MAATLFAATPSVTRGAGQPAPMPAAVQSPSAPAPAPAVMTATIVARYPHDRAAFTQGLFIRDGALFETTGREGESELRQVDLRSGRVLRRTPFPPEMFGEGSTAWEGEIIGLTWRHGVAFRWDAKTFALKGRFRYRGEGWGLTQDGASLILSDGSPQLRFLDPGTFRERRRLTVTFRGRPLGNLNELEWVDGAILANVWHQDAIVRIDPGSGAVTQVIDLAPLAAEIAAADPEAVPNGIAWDAANRRLFVTGKLWPTLYQIAWPAG